MSVSSLRETRMPSGWTSTWKTRVASASQSVAVTLTVVFGGQICPEESSRNVSSDLTRAATATYTRAYTGLLRLWELADVQRAQVVLVPWLVCVVTPGLRVRHVISKVPGYLGRAQVGIDALVSLTLQRVRSMGITLYSNQG